MPEQVKISSDAQYLQLTTELTTLKKDREKTRPLLYALLAMVLGLLGIVLLPSALAFLFLLLGLASGMAFLTALSKGSRLGQRIAEVETQLKGYAPSQPGSSAAPSSASSTADRLAQLQSLLDNKMITQTEYDAKRSALLREL